METLKPSGHLSDEEFTPPVNPDDLKKMWNLERDNGGERGAIGSVFAEFLSPGANVRAVYWRAMIIRILSRIFEHPEHKQAMHEAQELGERFLKLQGKDSFFAVMARIPVHWPKEQGPGPLPFDLEEFLDEVEREAA